MGKSDFEGDVASPLARFKRGTRWALRFAALALAIEVAAAFMFLQSIVETSQSGQGWRLLLPCVAFVSLGCLIKLADIFELHSSEYNTLQVLERILVEIGFGVIFFMLFIANALERSL